MVMASTTLLFLIAVLKPRPPSVTVATFPDNRCVAMGKVPQNVHTQLLINSEKESIGVLEGSSKEPFQNAIETLSPHPVNRNERPGGVRG